MYDFVNDFDPHFYRPCVFPILTELGYGTAISVNNGVHEGSISTTMLASLSFLDSSGNLIKTLDNILRIEPGEIVKIDTRDYLAELPATNFENLLGIIHLVPERYFGKKSVTVSKPELRNHVNASDDFIEFRQEPKGVITGVAYQTGHQNDEKFISTRRTLVQAPKVIIRKNLDTLFALINASTSFTYDRTARFDYVLLGPDGKVVAKSHVVVPAWTYRLISIHELLNAEGLLDEFISIGGLGMIIGSSKDAGLIPLSLTRNLNSGAIACDHSLPPSYYFTTWGGQERIYAHDSLSNKFFG